MKNIKALAAGAIILTSVLTLQGCLIVADGHDDNDWTASDHQKLEEKNRRHIAALSETASPESVRTLMGTPDFVDRMAIDGTRYEVLYYRTHRVEADGNTTMDECTPVVFVDGELVGTGQLALNHIPQVD